MTHLTHVNLIEVVSLTTPFLVIILIVVMLFINSYSKKKLDNVALLLYKEKEILYHKLDTVLVEMGYCKKTLEVIEKVSIKNNMDK